MWVQIIFVNLQRKRGRLKGLAWQRKRAGKKASLGSANNSIKNIMKYRKFNIDVLMGSSWLNYKPERLQLLMTLLQGANEEGQLLFNANEYCRMRGMERTALSRLLSDFVDMGFIAKETRKGKTWVSVCNYADYIDDESATARVFAKDEQRERAEVEFREEKETKETKEKKSSPCTPLKEEKENKEKKEKVVNKNKKKKEFVEEKDKKLCHSIDNKLEMNAKRVLKLNRTPIEERRKAFADEFFRQLVQNDAKGQTLLKKLELALKVKGIEDDLQISQVQYNFVSYWCQEVEMIDDEGDTVGTVLLREAQDRWSWLHRLLSFVQKGLDIKQDLDAHREAVENQRAASKARLQASEASYERAKAQAVVARHNAGLGGEQTEEEIARLDAGFSDFSRLYSVKANKQKAREEWRKLTLQEKFDALLNAPAFCVSCDADELKIPHPHTYLCDKRWTDEISRCCYGCGDDEEVEIQVQGLRLLLGAYGVSDDKIDELLRSVWWLKSDDDEESDDEDSDDDEEEAVPVEDTAAAGATATLKEIMGVPYAKPTYSSSSSSEEAVPF